MDVIALIPDEIITAALKNIEILDVYLALNCVKLNKEAFTVMLTDNNGRDICRAGSEWRPYKKVNFGFHKKGEMGCHVPVSKNVQLTKMAYEKLNKMRSEKFYGKRQ